MQNLINILNSFNITIDRLRDISPRSLIMDKNISEFKYFKSLMEDIRFYLYRYAYDSRILLMLAEDADLEEMKDRLRTDVIPYLLENKLI